MSFLDLPPNPDPRLAQRRPLYYFLILTLGVGATSSLFTTPAIPTWYAGLIRPAFAPPDWTLAPVWTLLYILMAFAAFRVWRKAGLRSPAMLLFALQLALDLGWIVVFFALHQIAAALLVLLLLDLAVLFTLALFFRQDRLAGALFLPILAWMVYTTLLVQAFWRLNA